MAINAGSVYSELILDGSKYFNTLTKAERSMQSFSGKLNHYGSRMEQYGKTLTKKVTLPVTGLITAASGVVAAFGWKRLTGLDTAQAQLKGLGYAIEDVERISGQVSAAVQGTTMTMAEGTSVAAGALAAGVKEGAELERYIKLVGSAAVGANRDVGDMAMIFNRVQGSGRLMTQELNSIEAGMPGFAQAMSDSLGVPLEKFREMVTDGKVTSKQFLDVMDDFAGGMADAYAASWDGMVSNTKANIGIIGQSLLGGVFEQSKESIAEFLEMLRSDDVRQWASETGQKIGETFTQMVDKAKDIVKWWTNLDDGTQRLIVRLGAMAVAAGPLLSVSGKLLKGASTFIGVTKKMSGGLQNATFAFQAVKGGAATFSEALAYLKGTTGATAAATTTLGKGFSLTGAAAKAGALLLNPWVLGITAATVGGVALYNHLKQDAIPAVELFGEGVSKATEKAVGGFLELHDEATLALNQLSWSGQKVTAEMAENLISAFAEMNGQILEGMDERHKQSLESVKAVFENTKEITAEEQAKILSGMEEHHEKEKQSIAEKEKRIKEILQTAAEEKRELRESEKAEINRINSEIKELGIKHLSESEKEQQIILSRMKNNAEEITAQQAAEVVRNSVKQMEETIANAERQRDESVAEFEYLRDEVGAISEEQADKLIKEAKRQCDDTTNEAKRMHENVVEEAQKQAKEHVGHVDWETGEIKSKWKVMVSNISKKARDLKNEIVKQSREQAAENARQNEAMKKKADENWENMKQNAREKFEAIKKTIIDSITSAQKKWDEKVEAMRRTGETKFNQLKGTVSTTFRSIVDSIQTGINKIHEWNATSVKEKVFSIVENITRVFSSVGDVGSNARGTSFWKGGLTWVGEEGPELIDLPRGSKVYSNQKSIQMAKAAVESLGFDLPGQSSAPRGASTSGRATTTSRGDINQYITINSPEPLSPSETARKNLQVSRQLAMEWM